MKRSTRRRLPVLALLFSAPLFVSYTADVDAEQTGAADAGACESAADHPGKLEARLAGAVERARASDAARDVIVLNGQGYNYAAGPARELEQRQREQASRQRDD